MRDIEAASPLPTTEAIEGARAQRDTAWEALRRALEGDTPLATDLPNTFEVLVHDADNLADIRYSELARVQDWERLRAEMARFEAQLPGLLSKLGAARHDAEIAEAAWREAWNPAGIAPQGPIAMREWVRDRAAVLTASNAARDARAGHAKLASQGEALRARLTAFLLSEAPAGLAALLRHASNHLRELDAQATRRSTVMERVAKAGKVLAEARRERDSLGQGALAWVDDWAPVSDRLGVPQGADPHVATEMLAAWSELDKELDRSRGLQARLTEMRTAIDEHDATLAALAQRLAQPVTETLVAELTQRQRAADYAATEQTRLKTVRMKRVEALATHAQAEANAEIELAALRRAAAVADDAGVRAVIAAEVARGALTRRRQECETNLRELADGKTTAELAEEAAALDIDAIPGRLDAIASRTQALDKAADASAGELVQVRAQLRAMEVGQDVAGPAQTIKDSMAEIEDAAHRYLRLRLAHALLRGGIDAYRRSQQGPLLARASLLFAELTGGRYTRLEQDEGDKGELFIVAVRPDSSTCPAGSLSEGATDQLFLALRLASIALEAEAAEPMPFIADDLLVNFDDQRTAAALRLLVNFGKTTQVILFTHHRHLLDLLQPGAASVHYLPRELAA